MPTENPPEDRGKGEDMRELKIYVLLTDMLLVIGCIYLGLVGDFPPFWVIIPIFFATNVIPLSLGWMSQRASRNTR